MSEGTIFFSYSRDNSEFVIKLANDLRLAGANVWMDQIDIKPGTRWDRSIEKALVSSQTLLVILSKSSVESNNVMDEVSFALEEGKHIVPVLLEECSIPFRLRRLQFADFTGDHEKGIKTLIAALSLEQQIASKLITSEASEPKEPKQESKKEEPVIASKEVKNKIKAPIKKSINEVTAPVKKTKKKSKIAILAIMSIAIIAIAFAAFKFMQPSEDEKHWKKSLTTNTLEDFDYHIQNFVECTHKEIATNKIALILQNDKDNIDWKRIKNSTDFIDFENHLETYTKCSHTSLANTKIASLANEIKDKNAWDKVLQEKSEATINSYLKEYPAGKYTRQASALLTQFNKEKQDWNIALKANSVSAYTEFLKKYPEGNFSADANSKLNVINAASTRKRDIDNWNRISRVNNTSAYYRSHLSTFKNCIHKRLAYDKIRAIDDQINYYKRIRSRPSIRAYYNYLTRYGGKKAIYFYYAKSEIYKIAKKRRSIGWVWQGRTTKDKKQLTGYNYLVQYATPNNKMPVAGDLMKSRFKLPIYVGADGGKKTSYLTQVNEVVIVLEVKLINYSDHTGCWLRVVKM